MTDQTDSAEQTDPAESELGDAGRRALEAERTARREAERRAKTAEEQLQEQHIRDLRAAIAAEKGLPQKAAGYLVGSTREELEQQADDLADAFRRPQENLTGSTRESLRPGAVPSAGDGSEVGKLADRIVRGT